MRLRAHSSGELTKNEILRVMNFTEKFYFKEYSYQIIEKGERDKFIF